MRQFTLSQQLRILGVLALGLLGTEFINLLLSNWLNQFGIRPREPANLPGVFLAPWLHANLTHFASNFLPLLLFM